MKRILVVDFNGTSSVYTHYLSNGLKGKDCEVEILGKRKKMFLDVFSKTNQYLGVKTGIKLLDYVLNWFWLLLNYKKYDAIIIQWLQLLKYIDIEIQLISYLQKRIPLIYIVHNLYPHNSNSIIIKGRYNSLYKTCKSVAVQTNEIKNSIKKIAPNKNLLRINHGLFFREFRERQLNSNFSKCLMIGYISKYKGVEDAIEVVKMLKEQNIIVSLEVIGLGKPEYISQLNQMIEEFRITDEVKIQAIEVPTQFLINKINKSAMLWLPYKEISQSGVAYTAMGLGTPIVAYDVGNFKEVFSNKSIAEIVDKGDLTGFCFAVRKVLENTNNYKKSIRELYTDDLWDENKVIIKEFLG